MQQFGNVEYLVIALMAFGLGVALLAASGALARSWAGFSYREWDTELSQRTVRGLRIAAILAGLIFIGLGILNVLRI